MGSSVKLPNPLPPGMPIPPISSTSVVEPTDQIYTCPLCHENQSSQKDFTTHIRGHNEVKPHSDPNDPTGKTHIAQCVYRQSHAYMMKIPMTYHEAPTTKFRLF